MFQKVFINGYSSLGSTNSGNAAKEEIYEALRLRGPLLGTIELSRKFAMHCGDHVLRPEDIESGSEYSPSSDDSSSDDRTGTNDSSSSNKSGDDDPGSQDSGSHESGSHESGSQDSGSQDSGSHASDDAVIVNNHAIVIFGMDFVEDYFLILNSQGLNWGKDGEGKVDCSLIFDILEPLIDDDRNRGMKGPALSTLSYPPKQQRELKHLGKAMPEKCLATGLDFRGCLSDVKPALLGPLDAVYEKNPFENGSAAPKKFVEVADIASSASSSGLDSFPREDSGGKITLALLIGLEGSDWKTCMESIEAVNKILEKANKRVQPTVELFGNLRGLLGVRHQNLIMATLSTIGGIASAMGPGIEKASKHVTHSPKSFCVLGSVGEPINPAWRWFYHVIGALRCPISDTWCQTETGSFMITSLSGAWPQNPGSATFPFSGVQPAKVDDKGSGYLGIKGSWPGAFQTLNGDVGHFSCVGCRRDKDGYYGLTGRVNDTINASGHGIGTAEVKSALVSHPKCTEAAVFCVEYEVEGQGIYALVTVAKGVQYCEELGKSLVLAVRKQDSSQFHWNAGRDDN